MMNHIKDQIIRAGVKHFWTDPVYDRGRKYKHENSDYSQNVGHKIGDGPVVHWWDVAILGKIFVWNNVNRSGLFSFEEPYLDVGKDVQKKAENQQCYQLPVRFVESTFKLWKF